MGSAGVSAAWLVKEATDATAAAQESGATEIRIKFKQLYFIKEYSMAECTQSQWITASVK